jgi:hypothetical protein
VHKLSLVSLTIRSFHCTEFPIIRLFRLPVFKVSSSDGECSNTVAANIVEGNPFIGVLLDLRDLSKATRAGAPARLIVHPLGMASACNQLPANSFSA